MTLKTLSAVVTASIQEQSFLERPKCDPSLMFGLITMFDRGFNSRWEREFNEKNLSKAFGREIHRIYVVQISCNNEIGWRNRKSSRFISFPSRKVSRPIGIRILPFPMNFDDLDTRIIDECRHISDLRDSVSHADVSRTEVRLYFFLDQLDLDERLKSLAQHR
jgi:hypothetical protein